MFRGAYGVIAGGGLSYGMPDVRRVRGGRHSRSNLTLAQKGGAMYDTSFIDELASAAPTPGGGGASAYAGALAAALASMVGNLTVGKKTYADVEDMM